MLFVASPNPACDRLSAGRYEPQYDNCYPRGDEYDDDQSSSNNDDVVGDCLILTDAVGGDNIDDLTSTTQYLQQPSLLMSSVLLESLPLPIPSDDVAYDDPLALFTRRMQKYHATNLTNNRKSTIQAEDDLLERRLSDTIHWGYLGSRSNSSSTVAEQDHDYFDTIVMEEIMNVPWPFDVLNIEDFS